MSDKYYVYRPLLDLIGYTEGTDEGDGYNETLAYGQMLDGVSTPKGKRNHVMLTNKTLQQILRIQRKIMLKDPDNKWNSSAIGRYQIVSKTLASIIETLKLELTLFFDEDMQDRMACYLLGVRGIDKYLAGRLSEDTLINNLAHEWASLPLTSGKGAYGGQNARVTPDRVRKALAEVKKRHREGQPIERVPVPVDKPYVPKTVEKEVKQKANWFGTTVGGGGIIGGVIAFVQKADWNTILMFGAVTVIGGGVALVLGPWIVNRIKKIREIVETE